MTATGKNEDGIEMTLTLMMTTMVMIMMTLCGSRIHHGHDVLRTSAERDRHLAGPGNAAVQSRRPKTSRLLDELHVR